MTQINTKVCTRCDKEKDISEFTVDKKSKDGLNTRCKECIAVLRKLDRLENPERYILKELRYGIFNRAKKRESDRKSKKANPAKRAANNSNYRTKKVEALVAWRDQDKITALYAEAQRLEKVTGIKYHVDHIVPLSNKYVCGLHCEFNLRIVPWFENLKKSNRFNLDDYLGPKDPRQLPDNIIVYPSPPGSPGLDSSQLLLASPTCLIL